jgi:hypothetical protein
MGTILEGPAGSSVFCITEPWKDQGDLSCLSPVLPTAWGSLVFPVPWGPCELSTSPGFGQVWPQGGAWRLQHRARGGSPAVARTSAGQTSRLWSKSGRWYQCIQRPLGGSLVNLLGPAWTSGESLSSGIRLSCLSSLRLQLVINSFYR